MRDLEQKKKVKKPKEEEWVPTQEELLEEAKITELENIKSLGKNKSELCICRRFYSLHHFYRKIPKNGERKENKEVD